MSTIEKVKRRRGTAFVVSFSRHGRYKISLPSYYTMSDARALASCVDEILVAERRGVPPRVQSYLDSAPPEIIRKLVAVGLVEVERLETLDDVLVRYVADIKERLKPSTVSSLLCIFKLLRASLDFSLTPSELTTDVCRRAIATATRGKSTAYSRQILTAAKTFYSFACPDAVVNPFKNVSLPTARKIEGRDFNVPAAWTAPILDACPTREWRSAFVLWRFGGLRFREAYRLTWADVLFDRKRLVVHADKTQRYGKEIRVIPLFPEIEKELDELFLESERENILSPLSVSTARNTFRQIVAKAGFTPWTRLFQNIRATRENELVEKGFPAHVVADWLGHSSAVQSKYYLRVLDSYFDAATSSEGMDERVDSDVDKTTINEIKTVSEAEE